MSDFNKTNKYLFEIITKNIKLFAIVAIVAVIVSIIISSPSIMAPKYKSTAVVYPSNLEEYSEESPIEQMIQWFESVEIKDRVIADNDLASHYDIDKEDKLYFYNIFSTYDENISISETRYESAEISVVDEDPEMAFKIVNSIIDNFSEIVRAAHKKRTEEDLEAIKNQFNKTKLEMDSVAKELKLIRVNYNVVNYSAQTEEVTKGFLGTFDGANKTSSNKDEIRVLKKNLEEKGGDFIILEQHFYQLLGSYKDWDKKYREKLIEVNSAITFTNVVTAPYVSHKKVYPVRWLIVAVSLMLSLLFTFVVLLFFNKMKQE